MGAWKEEQGGESRRSAERRQMRDRGTEGRTGHARYAAKEPEVMRRNPRDGTWRRLGYPLTSEPLASVKVGTWRPWEDEAVDSSFQTIVSIFDPSTKNNPEYFISTFTRSEQGSPFSRKVFYLLYLFRYF